MRLTSLDVFRGMTMATMILVNMASLPDDGKKYLWLDHAAWHGWTIADLVFPFFLYIIGVSMAFSLAKYTSQAAPITKQVYWQIARRSLILFGLGLLLNNLVWNYNLTAPTLFANLDRVRIMGVLQRIGIGFFCASIAVLLLPPRKIWILSISILVGYWLILAFIPALDNSDGIFSKAGNFGAYVDRLIITPAHLHKGSEYKSDPEGLFGTLPAISSILFGYLTGAWLKAQSVTSRTSTNLLMFGLTAVVIGLLWNGIFPINKKLWTSSFVMFTTGAGLISLAACYELVDVRKYKQWFKPFEILGLNAIFIYVASIVLIKLIMVNQIGSGKEAKSLYEWLNNSLFGWAGDLNSGVLFAIATVLLWLGVAYLMYRRRWFLKI
ncbi:heparan-alpha-glucosaminide N-acetyltransferase domain-containing protein [Chamaesiphon sp. GL140_3_metabinner_50]|uniref:acyltransferase family protein n=1 Tax=Chamaesiphon sp. GL140_3_metabinner_50 TaxID=2970812 RepID=UPI0025E5B7EC|nr:heparan-alpha-glucosaminide N-acetyltransferase domain-containing protein [Chamaesiphon sp. GL140_3_metabinner_50]